MQFATYATGSISGLAVSDYVYRNAADAQNAGTKVVLDGFLAWVPATSTAQSAEFHGLVRTSYTRKLQGQFYDNTLDGRNDVIDQCLVKAASALQTEPGAADEFDLIVVHPSQFANLVLSQDSKLVVMKDGQEEGRFGGARYGLITDWGTIPVKQSRFIPPEYAFLISSKSWTLFSAGKIGIVNDMDGKDVDRDSGADSYTLRMAALGIELGCNAPGWNMCVKL